MKIVIHYHLHLVFIYVLVGCGAVEQKISDFNTSQGNADFELHLLEKGSYCGEPSDEELKSMVTQVSGALGFDGEPMDHTYQSPEYIDGKLAAPEHNDGDLIPDWIEVFYCYTNPWQDDSDNDGYADSIEIVLFQSDPWDPYSPGEAENKKSSPIAGVADETSETPQSGLSPDRVSVSAHTIPIESVSQFESPSASPSPSTSASHIPNPIANASPNPTMHASPSASPNPSSSPMPPDQECEIQQTQYSRLPLTIRNLGSFFDHLVVEMRPEVCPFGPTTRASDAMMLQCERRLSLEQIVGILRNSESINKNHYATIADSLLELNRANIVEVANTIRSANNRTNAEVEFLKYANIVESSSASSSEIADALLKLKSLAKGSRNLRPRQFRLPAGLKTNLAANPICLIDDTHKLNEFISGVYCVQGQLSQYQNSQTFNQFDFVSHQLAQLPLPPANTSRLIKGNEAGHNVKIIVGHTTEDVKRFFEDYAHCIQPPKKTSGLTQADYIGIATGKTHKLDVEMSMELANIASRSRQSGNLTHGLSSFRSLRPLGRGVLIFGLDGIFWIFDAVTIAQDLGAETGQLGLGEASIGMLFANLNFLTVGVWSLIIPWNAPVDPEDRAEYFGYTPTQSKIEDRSVWQETITTYVPGPLTGEPTVVPRVYGNRGWQVPAEHVPQWLLGIIKRQAHSFGNAVVANPSLLLPGPTMAP